MSHHFDTKLAKEDPSLNLCDYYLFAGAPGTTVMAMTVNPDLGLSAPDTLHVEGLYTFRFDLNGDAREEVVFKFRFSEPRHANGDEHVHIQKFQVRKATGDETSGDSGELLIQGETGEIHEKNGVRAFVGVAPELFAGDAVALHGFLQAFYTEHRCNADAFLHRQNFFAKRNLTAIVLEVPNALIGNGKIHSWATISLYGHAPEMQVSRWGLPLITHLFLNDPGQPDIRRNTILPFLARMLHSSLSRSENLPRRWLPMPARCRIPRNTAGKSSGDCVLHSFPTRLELQRFLVRLGSTGVHSLTMSWT